MKNPSAAPPTLRRVRQVLVGNDELPTAGGAVGQLALAGVVKVGFALEDGVQVLE